MKLPLSALLTLIAIQAIIFNYVKADDPHHYESTIVSETTIINEECRGDSIAMAMSGHQFDFATNALQLSLAGASYKGCDALAFGGATKLSERLLLNGSGGYSAGEWGGVVSITMRF